MICYPNSFGSMFFSSKQIETAINLKKEYKNKKVYITNKDYNKSFLKYYNLLLLNDLDEINKDDLLVIENEKKETIDYLIKNNIVYYDTTSLEIKKEISTIINKYKDNYKIILIGNNNLNIIINSYINYEGLIIKDINDLKILNKDNNYFILSNNNDLEIINYLFKNNFNYELYSNIEYDNKILKDSIKLSKNVDIMIVINDINLYNEIKQNTKTYYFDNINTFYDFILKKKLNKNINIGFTTSEYYSKEEVYKYSYLYEFIIYYKETKKKIEKEIIKLNKSIKLTNNDIINESINKFINSNSDGKCIRGTLIDLGYRMNNNNNDEKAIPLASAYETFETSILIHDDIIDNSDYRRGKITIHTQYKDEFKSFNIDNTPTSLALCLGDAGFFYTNNYIIKNYRNNPNLDKILEYYNNIVINTINGEILDVYLPYIEKNNKKHILNESDIEEIYKLKTSIYTIVGPFILGMILSNSKQKEIKKMESILEPIGVSFQIKDDILGIFSNKNDIGKSNTSDIEEFKQTILYSYIKIYKKEYLNELLKYYGTKVNEKDLEKIKQIFIESGALEYANNKMIGLFNISKLNIKLLNIDQNIKRILLGLITFLEIRKK